MYRAQHATPGIQNRAEELLGLRVVALPPAPAISKVAFSVLGVRRQLFLWVDDNYFSLSTTITL
jgi:hypothetical protein